MQIGKLSHICFLDSYCWNTGGGGLHFSKVLHQSLVCETSTACYPTNIYGKLNRIFATLLLRLCDLLASLALILLISIRNTYVLFNILLY